MRTNLEWQERVMKENGLSLLPETVTPRATTKWGRRYRAHSWNLRCRTRLWSPPPHEPMATRAFLGHGRRSRLRGHRRR
jgi:hypothetical protein